MTMTIKERNEKLAAFFVECMALLEKKGADYNPTGITFDDLEQAAFDIDKGPIHVLWIYMSKHISAVRTFIKRGSASSEPIEGRLMDLANYCAMMATLIRSKKEEEMQP